MQRYQRLGSSVHASLGKGSYGTVVPAWDAQSHRMVALKQQPRESDEATRELFFFQAVPLHPNLCTLLDFMVDGEVLLLVLEYLPHSLSDEWHRCQGFLDFDLVRRYGRHIGLGLAHLHFHGVAHRDLHMQNLLMDPRANSVKVADLGLAVSAADFVLDRPITAIWFRAPEALLAKPSSKHPVTLTAGPTTMDLWSYGCVLAALFTGTHLFGKHSAEPLDVFRAQVKLLGMPCIEAAPGSAGSPAADPGSAGFSAADLVASQPVFVGDWPEIRNFEQWASFSNQASLSSSRVPTETLLTQRAVARRPFSGNGLSMTLCLALLQWNPARRLPAADAAKHPALDEAEQSTLEPGPRSDRSTAGSRPSCDSVGSPAAPTDGVCAAGEVCAPGEASAAASGSERVPSQGCQCSGNCGNPKCNAARKKYYTSKKQGSRSFCSKQPLPGLRLCEQCKCEAQGCTSMRCGITGYSGRWCKADDAKFGTVAKRQFVSPSGLQDFGRPWTWELRTAAAWNFMLRRMCPCDAEAFYDAADVLWGDTMVLHGHLLLQLWVAAYIKWPLAVREWVQQMVATQARLVNKGGAAGGDHAAFGAAGISIAAPGAAGVSTAAPASWTASEYTRATLAVAQSLSSLPLVWMHRQISNGRQNMLFGLPWWLKGLGLIATSDESGGAGLQAGATPNKATAKAKANAKANMKPCRKRAQTGSEGEAADALADRPASKAQKIHRPGEANGTHRGSPATDIVRLGVGSQEYMFDSRRTGVWQTLVDVASSQQPIPVPTTKAEVIVFVDSLKSFFRRLPDFGTTDPRKEGYKLLFLVRKFLLQLDREQPTLFGSFTVAELRQLTPDEHDHLANLDQCWTLQHVEDVFGIKALMLSCWTCLLGEVDQSHRRVFASPNMSLARLMESLKAKHDNVEPCLATLAAEAVALH